MTVDNRPGASQAIAAEATAKAAPDGYTLSIAAQSQLVLTSIARKKLPYDPVRDFAPISLLFTTPLYLIVYPEVPAKSVRELIALARSQPGRLMFASLGEGTALHLAGEMFKTQANIDIFHVPYKGTTTAMSDLLAGRVQMMFVGGVSALPHAASGKLRVLGSTAQERTQATPDLPTISEAGVPGYDVTPWFGLVAPTGVPLAIIVRLNREAGNMVRSSSTREKFASASIDLKSSTPEQFAERIRTDFPVWTKIMRAAGIQQE